MIAKDGRCQWWEGDLNLDTFATRCEHVGTVVLDIGNQSRADSGGDTRVLVCPRHYKQTIRGGMNERGQTGFAFIEPYDQPEDPAERARLALVDRLQSTPWAALTAVQAAFVLGVVDPFLGRESL